MGIDFDFQKNEQTYPGALDHFVDIDLLPPDKIEILKTLYDSFQKDASEKKRALKEDKDNGEI